ncbi:MAG: ammonium transporter [Candidatus Hydrogenedentota bacterium]
MRSRIKLPIPALLVVAVLLALAPAVFAQEEAAAPPPSEVEVLTTNLNIVWTCVAAFLVMFMQAGFALVELGLTRAKNGINIMMKNLMDFCIGSVGFFMIGYALMFGPTNGFFGTEGFFLSAIDYSSESPFTDWNWTFLIFQTVFCATAATIVSGAMAERTKFVAYLLYSAAISIVIYPISGSWAWGGLLNGGGWLEAPEGGFLANAGLPGFCDFAGSTVVHSVGGWLALAGAIVLGPRTGKYGPDGTPRALPGHNIPLVALGVFILWLGWFGFNPGSATTGDGTIGYVAVTTNLAAACGAISAMITAWIIFKKPEATMTLNGALAGLVSITAPCYTVSPLGACAIGLIGGVLVVISVIVIDRVIKIDDPVGAVSVHGVCGVWGTLACGLFNLEGGLIYGGGAKQLITQLIGAGAFFVWAFGLGLILFFILKMTVGLRVSAEEELKGLDIGEHGMEAYNGFQIFTTQ